jgi:hypothetical protein
MGRKGQLVMERRTVTSEQSEQDIRLDILNTLLTTPHRALDKTWPVWSEMAEKDPLFFMHLAAWHGDNGEVRDHKEMFIVALCLSGRQQLREVGLALLPRLAPYQIARIVDFIHCRYDYEFTSKRMKIKGQIKDMPVKTGKYVRTGLGRNIPGSLRKEVRRYLHEREAKPSWFDSCVLRYRDDMKRLYRLLRINRSDRAQGILFEDRIPSDSKLVALRALRDAKTPADQARIIVANGIPYTVASTLVDAMTPTILVALIEVMSDQELINSMGSLKRRGAFDNDDIKKMIHDRLGSAKTGKRVAAMKGSVAIKASGVDEETKKALEDVSDAQVKSKGSIKRPTALLVDKSTSMSVAIDIGKRIGAMLSAVMADGVDLFAYAFDTAPYPIEPKGTSLADWEREFELISANGATCCGAGIQALIRNKQRVEQIIMVTDEGHNRTPPFLGSLEEYGQMFGVPHVVFLKCGRHCDKLEGPLERAGHSYDAYEFDGDYTSLPGLIPFLTKGSQLDLMMDIMEYPLPKRRAYATDKVAVA